MEFFSEELCVCVCVCVWVWVGGWVGGCVCVQFGKQVVAVSWDLEVLSDTLLAVSDFDPADFQFFEGLWWNGMEWKPPMIFSWQ